MKSHLQGITWTQTTVILIQYYVIVWQLERKLFARGPIMKKDTQISTQLLSYETPNGLIWSNLDVR